MTLQVPLVAQFEVNRFAHADAPLTPSGVPVYTVRLVNSQGHAVACEARYERASGTLYVVVMEK